MRTLYLLVALAGLFGIPPAFGESPPKPNVVLIVADDLRPDALRALGNPDVKTPHLDRLAGRGCAFPRATCGYPICHVSRTELLTGRCLVADAAAGKAVPVRGDWAVWPEVMKAGWHTVHCGKWHVDGTPWTRGYVETAGLFSGSGAGGRALTQLRSATGRPVTGYTAWTFKTDRNEPLPDPEVGLTPDTDTLIGDRAVEVIRAGRKRPLFLHVNFTAPHDPLHWPPGRKDRFAADKVPLPKNFAREHPFDHGNRGGRDEAIVPAPRDPADIRRERAVYFALVEHLDVQVGRIVKALDEAGKLDRTLFLFTSDHGLALGSHGLMGKQNQYEHTINVPLILAGPGVPKGKRPAAQCHLRDLFLTVCDLAGVPVPAGLDGRSLKPVLAGEADGVHDAVFGYFTDTQRMMRTGDGWKLIWYPKAGRTQLFHVAADPHEVRDLAADPAHRDRLRAMTGEINGWLRGRGDPLAAAN